MLAQAGFPKPPTGQPQMGFQANGQAINRGDIMHSLTQASAIKPNTGTATGDRAANDFAKSMLMQNQSQVGYDVDQSNAKTATERQGQKQQIFNAWNQARIGQYRNLSGQRSQQSQLAQELLRNQIAMNERWQTGLIGMMG